MSTPRFRPPVTDYPSAIPMAEVTRLLAQDLGAYICVIGHDLRFMFVNEPFAAALGFTPAQMVGMTMLDAYGESHVEALTGYLQRALAGEPFEKLAADLSDAPSKANAGLIGPLNLNDVSPDLRKLIDSMKVGQVTEVLRAPRGYQILKLESITAPETRSFEDAKNDISNKVFGDKRRVEFGKYLDKLRAEAIIEWKNPEIKKAYDLGMEKAKAAAAAGQ